MNLVGKIFIVLIFVMAILWMGFAVAVYAAHKNWKDYVENPDTGLNKQLEEAKNRTQQLKDEATRLKNELAAEKMIRADKLAKLQTEADNLSGQLQDVNRDLLAVRKARDDAVATLKTTQENEAALREEVVGFREELRTAQEERERFFAEAVKAQEELQQANNDLDTLKNRNLDLVGQLADARTVLDKHGLKDNPKIYEAVATRVDGVVLKVGANGLSIEISLGEDDGLLRGHTLEVYRQDGSAYLGRAEVTETSFDKAVCKILPTFRQGPVHGGDRVTTKLR